VADSSLSASERCLPRSCLYIIRLIIWSSHQKSKGSLKEWLWEIFMFKNEHYIYRWSVSRACWLTYWSDKVGLGFFSVLFCSCSLGKEKNDLDRLSRYRTLDSRFGTEWKRLKRYLMSLFSYPYQRIAESNHMLSDVTREIYKRTFEQENIFSKPPSLWICIKIPL